MSTGGFGRHGELAQDKKLLSVRSQTVGVLIAVFGAIVPLALVISSNFGTWSYIPLVLCLGIVFLLLLGFEWRRAGHPLTPVGVICLGGLLIAVLRPITIQTSGFTTAGALLDSRRFVGPVQEAAVVAIAQWLLFVVSMAIIYLVLYAKGWTSAPASDQALPPAVANRAVMLLLGAMVIALVSAALLIQSSGGLAAHFSGVSVRSAFLAGRYYLTLGYVPLAVALVLYVEVRRRSVDLTVWTPLALVAAVLLLLTAFITGGRGPLVLGAVLPLLLLKQTGPRPISNVRLVLLGAGMIIAAMIMSLALRENQYDGGESLQALETNPVATLLDRLTSGAETRPFDSLTLLNMYDREGEVPRLYGSTYPKLFTYFLPSSIYPAKDGGANTFFTERYLPRFYYPFRIETSISAVGEGFLNFGWIGVALSGALVGFAAARFLRLGAQASVTRKSLQVLLTPIFFSFVRGDSYQNLSLALFVSALVVMGVRAIGASISSGPDISVPPSDVRLRRTTNR
ncbi:O-antigen polysaccharide polymerase Wzy [Aeromicrobium sp. CnD17-E]|uniref:O-antigen polysaccharide polymerase Wzy n=1 Tax=Aeromicrobium sp. CnD17-E TaxID=2954487 RepID=UPI0020986057|nr:O-antigen polysaccharide polymerase Wzy [Aeromicrobium sp. CnD17-E]MCO7239733.1 O-antigen polysaccharide polymerase Wzy [Aeromicrobium sp. CnD17-E]